MPLNIAMALVTADRLVGAHSAAAAPRVLLSVKTAPSLILLLTALLCLYARFLESPRRDGRTSVAQTHPNEEIS